MWELAYIDWLYIGFSLIREYVTHAWYARDTTIANEGMHNLGLCSAPIGIIIV